MSRFGPFVTVYGRFRVWRDAGLFQALPEGVITEAVRQGETDLSLVSVSFTTARIHRDDAGMHAGKDLMEALEEAACEQEKARPKRGGPEERDGQAERRRVRRRCELRLKEALPGRSRVGRPARFISPRTASAVRPGSSWPSGRTRTARSSSRYSGPRLRASAIWIDDLLKTTH